MTEPSVAAVGEEVNPSTAIAVPQMPRGVLVGLARDFVDLQSEFTECPEEFLWSSFVTFLGLVVSPYVARSNAMKTQPRLFTCNVGRSGAERKSTGANRSMRLNDYNPDDKPFAVMEGFGSAEGLLTVLKQSERTPVLSYLDELEILFKKAAVTGSAGVSVLHQLYESNSYSHTLKSGNLSVTDAHLAIVANSTFDRFPDLWQSSDIDSGFFSRWMLVVGRATKRLSDPPSVPEDKEKEISDRILNLRISLESKAKTERYLIPFADAKASELWNDFYVNGLDPNNRMQNRIDTIGDRLMSILTLAQNQFAISVQTVEAVIEFLRYEIQVRDLLCPRVAVTKSAELEQRIIMALPLIGSTASKRDIHRTIHAERYGSELFKKALEGLCEAGRLKKHLTKKEYERLW